MALNNIARAAKSVTTSYQEAQQSFDKQREKALGGLPWIMGVVADVIDGLHEEYPKARFKRVFWDHSRFPKDENPGCWVLEITYPASGMGSIIADSLENDFCLEIMEKHGVTVNLVSRSRRS